MNCRNFRELAQSRIVDLLGRDLAGAEVTREEAMLELEKWDMALAQHAGGCEHCERFWYGLFVQVRMLVGLERLATPGDLAGRVVAALNAGYREDRAAGQVATLATLAAPPVLARRLEQEFRVKAPAALDRMVEDRLQQGARPRSRRFARAPKAIAAAAILGLALWVTLPDRSSVVAATRSAGATPAPAAYDFEIVQVDSLREASLDAGAMAWVASITGGVTSSE